MPFSPPLTLAKYEKMQYRRVEVQVHYTAHHFKHQAAAAIAIIKEAFPDVRVQRVITLGEGAADACVFRIVIDDQLISTSREPFSIYLPMRRLDAAVQSGRLRRRPRESTIYRS